MWAQERLFAMVNSWLQDVLQAKNTQVGGNSGGKFEEGEGAFRMLSSRNTEELELDISTGEQLENGFSTTKMSLDYM